MRRAFYILSVLSFLIFSFTDLSVQNIPADLSVKIFFLGDFDFGERYQTNPKFNNGINIINEYGYDYILKNIKGLLETSNFTIANLETPLLDSFKNSSASRKPYIHWSSSDSTTNYLKKYRINTLSLGNNHTMDCGINGLNQTMNSLQKNGLNYFGAGLNTEEAGKPLVKQFILNGDTITIAVFSGFEYRKSYDSIYNFYAGENSAGMNAISTNETAMQIKELRQKYPDAYIIFFPHWGRNYLQKTEMQTETAHSLIDTGVDLIIGTGAHTIQQIESYKEKFIFYCIGNSVFNAPGRYKSYGVKPYSLIASLEIKSSEGRLIKQLCLYPIFTDNFKTDYQVRFLDEDEFADCLLYLERMSADKKNLTAQIMVRKIEMPYSFCISLNY
jgi:hypothetical protein